VTKQAYSHSGMTIQITAALDCLQPRWRGTRRLRNPHLQPCSTAHGRTARSEAKRCAVLEPNQKPAWRPVLWLRQFTMRPRHSTGLWKASCSWNFKIWRRKIAPFIYLWSLFSSEILDRSRQKIVGIWGTPRGC